MCSSVGLCMEAHNSPLICRSLQNPIWHKLFLFTKISSKTYFFFKVTSILVNLSSRWKLMVLNKYKYTNTNMQIMRIRLQAQTVSCRVHGKHLLTHLRSCPGWHVLSGMEKNCSCLKLAIPVLFCLFFKFLFFLTVRSIVLSWTR